MVSARNRTGFSRGFVERVRGQSPAGLERGGAPSRLYGPERIHEPGPGRFLFAGPQQFGRGPGFGIFHQSIWSGRHAAVETAAPRHLQEFSVSHGSVLERAGPTFPVSRVRDAACFWNVFVGGIPAQPPLDGGRTLRSQRASHASRSDGHRFFRYSYLLAERV